MLLDGHNVVEDVYAVLDAIEKFVQRVRNGEHSGATGKKLKNVVVIGIGGSYQSVEFVHEALKFNDMAQKEAEGRTLRFLANVDPVDFSRATEGN